MHSIDEKDSVMDSCAISMAIYLTSVECILVGQEEVEHIVAVNPKLVYWETKLWETQKRETIDIL